MKPFKEGKVREIYDNGDSLIMVATDRISCFDVILNNVVKMCIRDSCWGLENHMTYPLILAKIPVKNSWEIFAYLPFGGWNECPNTPELMAVAKYWFEKYGAVPAAMSHDELEFLLPTPVSQEQAMENAAEQYGFCPRCV